MRGTATARTGRRASVGRPAPAARSFVGPRIGAVRPGNYLGTVGDESTTDDAELRARIVAGMWEDGWVGTATITPEAVAERYSDETSHHRVESTLRSMFEDDDCPLRLDPEGSVGRSGSSVSVSPDPIAVQEYVESLDESWVPADLRHV